MCRLFETIRIENGLPLHLRWHEERMLKSGFRMQDAGCEPAAGLRVPGTRLKLMLRVPENMQKGIVRCNMIYEKDLIEVTFRHYVKYPVRSLKLVNADSIDYHLKYYDRKALEELVAMRGECDEIIIVKDGLITDSSISNLIFYNGSRWYTPANPLLEGTCRSRLLAEGKVLKREIRPGDLDQYQGCKLINAFREPEDEKMIRMEDVRFLT
ncbi:MAG: aminotransferase class IV [Bacteroidetes bacterium]|nr:aminotransferase class IV [Bacteroidota bacterium]